MLATREGSHLLHQFGAAKGAVEGVIEQILLLRILYAQQQGIDVSDHHTEQVVEVVGEAAAQQPDRLELLGMAQGLLRATVRGDVPHRSPRRRDAARPDP